MSDKKYWDNIYETKEFENCSWFQSKPTTSISFLKQFQIAKDYQIIDIGGGDSFFIDHLLEMGYHQASVLDISETAINKAKKRLGKNANQVEWINCNITDFKPKKVYDFWHDRAAFHFLTDDKDINAYIETASTYLAPEGILIIGAFSNNGPTKCSGLEITQYSKEALSILFKDHFEIIDHQFEDHRTPFGTTQNFIFCCFKRK